MIPEAWSKERSPSPKDEIKYEKCLPKKIGSGKKDEIKHEKCLPKKIGSGKRSPSGCCRGSTGGVCEGWLYGGGVGVPLGRLEDRGLASIPSLFVCSSQLLGTSS